VRFATKITYIPHLLSNETTLFDDLLNIELSNEKTLSVNNITLHVLIKHFEGTILLDSGASHRSYISKKYYLDLFQCAIHKFLSNYSNQNYQSGFKLGIKHSLEDEVIPKLIADKRRFYGIEFKTQFLDIGFPKDYLTAQSVLVC
jgi:NDP-sugar pyrophosphorylase family protein